MKKITLTCLFISLLFICKSFSQTSAEKKGWPSEERYSFISECIKTARVAMSEDSARFYCYCMQKKIETNYPTIDEAVKITEADMESAGWKQDIKNCLGGFWATKERDAFLSDCIASSQKGGLSEVKSKNYCECMLFKIENKFPNPADAEKLTPELLATPDWKKIIQSCLDF